MFILQCKGLGFSPGGTFLVARERVLQRPREDYEGILNATIGSPTCTGNFGMGHALEFGGWQRVFGEDWITPMPDAEKLCPPHLAILPGNPMIPDPVCGVCSM